MTRALPHKVTVYAATKAADSRGGRSKSWAVAVEHLSAEFQAGAGREFWQGGAVQNAATERVRVVYHGSITVQGRMRREPSGPTFEVLEVVPVRRGDTVRFVDCALIAVDDE